MDNSVRKFKAVNVLGLDFYVDWLENDGYFERIIAVKDVHGGRNFVYQDLVKDGVPVSELLLNACGVIIKEKEQPKQESKAEITAAQETEQPKETSSAKKTKRSIKQS